MPRRTLCIALLACLLASACAPTENNTATALTTAEVEEAYIWGVPIVAMYRYTVSMGTRVDAINQVFHNRELFEPGILPGGANRDTLYSFGWFDLQDEPYVVSLPDFGDRYFVWQMTDMYAHNFHNIGGHLRSGDTERYRSGYQFLLAGPDWDGAAPDGMDVVRAPVRMINVLYRIAVVGREDFAEGNRLQDATLTIPLSDWENGVRETTRRLPSNPTPEYREGLAFGVGVTGEDERIADFFSVLADAMIANHPYTSWDLEVVEGPLARIGLRVGEPFDLSSLDPADQETVLAAQASGFERMMELQAGGFGRKINGWQFGPDNHGNWEDDFLRRAYATYIGGMWPTPDNSTYALTYDDVDGNTLVGTNPYRLHFGADEIPPATNFWSITLYETGTFDLYPNEDGIYSAGSNLPQTVFAEDGSVTFLFAHERPADTTGVNWVPAPEGAFWLVSRFYAPTPAVLDGGYDLPGVAIVQ